MPDLVCMNATTTCEVQLRLLILNPLMEGLVFLAVYERSIPD
jgi:hypothetical protein